MQRARSVKPQGLRSAESAECLLPLNLLGAVVMSRALVRCPDTLESMTVQDIARIQSEVAEWWSDVRYVESATSTNTELLASGEPGHVLIADRQTGGKGRLGRAWEAPAGASLLMSVAVELAHTDDLGLVSLAAGVAVTDVVPTAQLKWPNDVLLNGKKFVGILGEIDTQAQPPLLVVGMGVNVSWREEDLPTDWSTALNLEGIDVDWDEFAIDLLGALGRRLEQWRERDQTLIDDYRAVSATLGQSVRLETATGVVEGVAGDVDKHGAIVVDGTSYSTGDVTHLRPTD